MDSQPKYNEYAPADLFRDGRVLQAPVPGTVSRADLALAEEAKNKPAVTMQLLGRGREQFDVYCSPCHDRAGSGHGMIVERGMPRPPNFTEQRLLAAEDQHFYEVISNGFGAMYGFADRVRPRDRWTIVAYLRAIQLSQKANFSDLPPDLQARVTAEKSP
jgi:mono/diheme cytochrome c family protein